MPDINQRWLDGLALYKPGIYYDSKAEGFAVRIYASGRASFVTEWREPGAQRNAPKRRLTIGPVDLVKIHDARERARQIMALVKTGRDPLADKKRARDEMTLAEASQEYRRAMARKWKAKTRSDYDIAWDKRILPVLGNRAVSRIEGRDVLALFSRISANAPIMANRVLACLRAFYRWWPKVTPSFSAPNPTMAVRPNPENSRQHFLTAEELRRLFSALDGASSGGLTWIEHLPCGSAIKRCAVVSPVAAAAIKVLALSACRRNEILKLQWGSVRFDQRRIVLPDSKTGFRSIPLCQPALDVILALQAKWPKGPADGDPVFCEQVGGNARADLNRPWRTICRAAGMPPGTKLHDLRHSAASLLINSGGTLETVAGLLGHKSVATARRYSHLLDATVRDAADLIGRQIVPLSGLVVGQAHEVLSCP